MDHKEFKNNAINYFNDELNDKDLQEFEIHMLECTECRDFILLNRSILSVLKETIKSSTIKELESFFGFEEQLRDGQKRNLSMQIIDLLTNIKSRVVNSLSHNVFCLDAVRDTTENQNVHAVNDKIVFSIDVPKAGILVVFHYDTDYDILDEGNKSDLMESTYEYEVVVDGRVKLSQKWSLRIEPLGRGIGDLIKSPISPSG